MSSTATITNQSPPKQQRIITTQHGAAGAANEEKEQQQAIHYGTWGSQVIPQPSTNQAQPRLTSEF
jgi:hypothetical protein